MNRKEHSLKRRSLQFKLTFSMGVIVFIVALILTLTSTAFLQYSNMNTLTESAYETLDAASTAVRKTFDALLNNARTVAFNDTIRNPASSRADKLAVMEQLRQENKYDEIGFVNLDGQGYSNYGEFDFNDQVHFQNASKGKLFVGEPIINRLNGQVILISAAPVYSSAQQITGTVYIVDTVASVNDMIAGIQFGKTGGAYVLNQDGKVIYHKDTQQIVDEFNALELAKTDDAYQSMAQATREMISGQEGIAEYRRDGSRHFAAYRPIPGYESWVLVMDALKSDFMETTTAAILIGLCLTFVLLILGVLLISRYVRRISTPIHQATSRLSLLSQGDLKTEVQVLQTDDEIGTLTRSLRETVEHLNMYLTEIRRLLLEIAGGNLCVDSSMEFRGDFIEFKNSVDAIAQSLNGTVQQINRTAEQVASGSEQVASGSQALSQGATQQASAVEELAATIDEISSQVNETARNAAETREETNAARDAITGCNQQMQDMIGAMDNISAKSNEIGKIIKTIEDIAFQTNILALNAAVEAARAGSAGKGFAVVADEVRNLANKSQAASKSTSALIEDTLRAVEKGTQMASETAESLAQVVENVAATAATVDKIASAANEQASSITQVTQGIDQISAVVQTNSATSQESAASSEELSGQAQTLKSLVQRFRLQEEAQGAALSLPNTFSGLKDS